MIGTCAIIGVPIAVFLATYLMGRRDGRRAAIEQEGERIFNDGFLHGIRTERHQQRIDPNDMTIDFRNADWWKGDRR